MVFFPLLAMQQPLGLAEPALSGLNLPVGWRLVLHHSVWRSEHSGLMPAELYLPLLSWPGLNLSAVLCLEL